MSITITHEPAHGSIVACLRHALLADVPVQAVNVVEFQKYESPMEDEMAALRLGQLPIKGRLPARLRITKTAAAGAPLTWVTDKDVQDPEGRVAHPPGGRSLLLVPLHAGQTLDVVCHTELGTGRQHTKWNTVFPVFHAESSRVTISTTGAIEPLAAWEAAVGACLAAVDTFAFAVHAACAAL